MQNKKKYLIISVLLLVTVVGTAVLAMNTELFQGKLFPSNSKKTTTGVYYSLNGKPVSVVASKVPSVVTSPLGPSVVASAVASGVLLRGLDYSREMSNIKILPKLTSRILLDLAKQDFIKNPAKYSMTNAEKAQVLNMYNILN
jgi:hypothetical protein